MFAYLCIGNSLRACFFCGTKKFAIFVLTFENTRVFDLFADEPEKFIYDKKRQTICDCLHIICRHYAQAVAFFLYRGFLRTYQQKISEQTCASDFVNPKGGLWN